MKHQYCTESSPSSVGYSMRKRRAAVSRTRLKRKTHGIEKLAPIFGDE